jgi:ribosome-associated translation inhibitor RaiA
MNIEIQSLNFSLTPAQSRYVEQQIDFALAANIGNIERVEVWLSETSIAEGSVVKRCLIQVELKGRSMVVIESTDLDLRVAIQRAAGEASEKLSRSVRAKIQAFDQSQPSLLWNNTRPEAQYIQNSI